MIDVLPIEEHLNVREIREKELKSYNYVYSSLNFASSQEKESVGDVFYIKKRTAIKLEFLRSRDTCERFSRLLSHWLQPIG